MAKIGRFAVALFLVMVTMSACRKESFPLTMDAAIGKVENIIGQYPRRDWFASKDIIPSETVLQYSQFGIVFPDPGKMHEYTTPGYRSWLVMIAEDGAIEGADDCLHIFIDADTGDYTQVWLKGQAIVQWGSTPVSRAAK